MEEVIRLIKIVKDIGEKLTYPTMISNTESNKFQSVSCSRGRRIVNLCDEILELLGGIYGQGKNN